VVLNKFEFDIEPVAVKYLTKPQKGIEELLDKMVLCEMLKKAQGSDVFYAGVKNHTCEAGPYVLGQKEIESARRSGTAECPYLLYPRDFSSRAVLVVDTRG
jgi:uncharacterized protein (DUF169 family)